MKLDNSKYLPQKFMCPLKILEMNSEIPHLDNDFNIIIYYFRLLWILINMELISTDVSV